MGKKSQISGLQHVHLVSMATMWPCGHVVQRPDTCSLLHPVASEFCQMGKVVVKTGFEEELLCVSAQITLSVSTTIPYHDLRPCRQRNFKYLYIYLCVCICATSCPPRQGFFLCPRQTNNVAARRVPAEKSSVGSPDNVNTHCKSLSMHACVITLCKLWRS